MYPLFHCDMRDNALKPSADLSERQPFPTALREDTPHMKYSFYESFAGGGMARAGLGDGWSCLFANDFDFKKSETYKKNWGDRELKTLDVGALKTSDLPGVADLAWGSFPYQDLSLAGGGAGPKEIGL